jgi:hypothetical protein
VPVHTGDGSELTTRSGIVLSQFVVIICPEPDLLVHYSLMLNRQKPKMRCCDGCDCCDRCDRCDRGPQFVRHFAQLNTRLFRYDLARLCACRRFLSNVVVQIADHVLRRLWYSVSRHEWFCFRLIVPVDGDRSMEAGSGSGNTDKDSSEMTRVRAFAPLSIPCRFIRTCVRTSPKSTRTSVLPRL